MNRRSHLARISMAVVLVLALAVGGAFAWSRWPTPAPPRTVAFSDALAALRGGRVAELTIGVGQMTLRGRDGEIVQTIPPPGFVAVNPAFLDELLKGGVRVSASPPGTSVADDIGLAIVAILVGAVVIGGVGASTGHFTFGRAVVRTAGRSQLPIMFSDVAGVDEAKDEVEELVQFLREPARFTASGGRIPRGVLLVGPPGTGKTLLARAIAGEAGVPFLFASGSDFVEKYVGVGASRVRRLFREARRHPAAIVFIDELDAVGRQRGSHAAAHEEREQTLNQLLVEMDGFDAQRSIVVVAASNRSDILDPALLRPGRFDRQVFVGNADVRGREEILRVHTRKKALGPDVDLRSVARGTPGFSGADLANVVNEAALHAARQGRTALSSADLEFARDKVLMGVERRSLVMTPSERVTCAYHEAGHAVVAACLPATDPLHKVTIVPRGQALGVTMQLPESDRHTHTKDYLEAQLTILMGGRVAEEVFLNQMTSGAANDIERATDIARRMVCVFGMSALGMQAFCGGTRGSDRPLPVSEQTARRIDEQIEQFLVGGYQRAHAIVDEQRRAVEALAQELLAVETLDATEIRCVLETHGTPPLARAS